MRFFESAILIFFLLHLSGKSSPIHMRYHLFLHHGWFLQNLGNDPIPTYMHTTVNLPEFTQFVQLMNRQNNSFKFKKKKMRNRSQKE